MKGAALLPLAVAAAAAASHMTLPFIDNAALVAAVDPADPGYRVCNVANEKVRACVRQAGGAKGLSTAAQGEVAQCVCCQGSRPISATYASCSSYLAEAAPTLATQYAALGRLHRLCGANADVCGGAVSATAASSTSYRLTTAKGAESTAESTVSEEPVTSLAPACTSMLDMARACTKAHRDFFKLPFGQQAQCYCCATAQGQVSWTDRFDGNAQTCRGWAKTVGSSSEYTVASEFATFCQRFSNACDPTNTFAQTEATATGPTGADITAFGGFAKGAGQPASTGTSPTGKSAASAERVSSALGLVAVAAIIAAI